MVVTFDVSLNAIGWLKLRAAKNMSYMLVTEHVSNATGRLKPVSANMPAMLVTEDVSKESAPLKAPLPLQL